MVMAEPFLRSLRASLKGELWGIGKTSAIHLYNGLELFDRFIPYDKKGFLPFLNAVESLKNIYFERAIMLPHSFRSALLFYGAHVKERTGYARNRRGFMLTRQVPEGPNPEPTVEHYLRIIDALGSRRLTDTPTLSVTADEEQRFDERHLDINRPYGVFIAGAQYGPSKRWPDTHFSELADMVVQKTGMDVYILPGKSETAIAQGIREGAKEKDRVHVKDLDIRELKVCISRASVVVSNDTGPRHIAAALSVPTVVLLGPMDERYTQYPNFHTHLALKDLPCRPCNKKTCDRDHECLKGIKPEDVFKKVEDILNG
ncbi:MAG: lipopolysaccharide heptosyltransferase II [Syntrophus sp. (in: bacteria)]|nr:lipopolysaccharide heptosyltransferase II [Syntrophus sp. (in: bacteria)]